MKGKEKFLFYYSLLAITILFFTSVFFSPKPQNFIALALLLPLILYFWIKATSPQSTTPNLWSIRIIAVMLILSVLGIVSYSLGKQQEVPQQKASLEKDTEKIDSQTVKELASKIAALDSEGSNEEVAKELAEIRKELSRISGQSSGNEVGGTSTTTLGQTTDVEDISNLLKDVPYGFVKIKDPILNELDVLDDASFSSRRIGTMKAGESYEFFEKNDGWYLIKLPDGNQGWVNQRDVEELYN